MKINYRQMSICVFMSFISVKLLAMPGWMYIESGINSWFVALVMMLIDLLYGLLIVELMKKCECRNIYEFMREIVGVVLAKIFLIFFGLKMLLVIGNLGKGMELFVTDNLYEEFQWILFGIPLLIVTTFMMYKGIRNIGRVMEVFWLAIVAGCIFIALKSCADVEILSFLPLFRDGAMPLLRSAFIHAGYFGSSTFLLLLYGDVDLKKGKTHNVAWYMLGAVVFVVGVMVVYYGLFDKTSPMYQFCLSDISQFESTRSTVGELNWLIVALWIVAQTIMFAMYGYCFTKVVSYLFHTTNPTPGILVVDIYILIWGFISSKAIHAEYLFISPFASWMTIITEYIIPLILWLGFWVKRRKEKKVKYEKTKNHI